jgi:hypothetical protein
LYDTVRWNNKGVKFREHTFLQNRLVPAALRDNRVRVSVAVASLDTFTLTLSFYPNPNPSPNPSPSPNQARGEVPPPSTAHAVHLRYGMLMANVQPWP